MFVAETSPITAFAPDASEPAPVWRQLAEPVEPFLDAVAERLARQVAEFDPALTTSARYALTGHGKQLRPTLVGLCAETTGGLTDAHITAAVIIELVHLATLVHDDVMDEAQLRRGRLTVAARWGNEHAVLFGDCLFAHALKLAAGFPTTEICRAVSSATKIVCTGEVLQNQQRLNFALASADYFRVLEMKTAELFSLSCDLGAYLNAAPPEQRQALRAFGMALGTAYQIYDDCLDVFGLEAIAGKSLGTDLAQGKLTLPVLLAWERASASERTALEQRLRAWDPGSLAVVTALLRRHDALERAMVVFNSYVQQARAALHKLPGRGQRLAPLTDFLVQQAASLGAQP
jgi:octaprenyl-diphosphate synthase